METQTHPLQVEIYRKMTPQQKYDIIVSLMESARKFKAASLRLSHPDWTPERIETEIREWFLNARQ